jgi:hypothetical protein
MLTEALAKEICDCIAQGQSVRRIVRRPGMPTEMTIYRWVNDDREGFGKMYAEARLQQTLRYQDEIMDIADDGSNDYYQDEEGQQKFDGEHFARSKLRVETRKWYLAKMLPRVFGDKQVIEHTGDVNVTIKNASEEDLRAKLAELTQRALARGAVTDVVDEAGEAEADDGE